uniref:Uncharacterized protein n=1 Tax=uncultured marine group II/III euryarchaeote KM3_74_C08 TaxID=1456501 RepID=A0A075HJB4_9EURY|nr:hypothetical protein [uncultured marine group II/III euryarchaeote KM3_74_C08]
MSSVIALPTTSSLEWITVDTFSMITTLGLIISAALTILRYREFRGSPLLVWLFRSECPWQGGPPVSRSGSITWGLFPIRNLSFSVLRFCPTSPSKNLKMSPVSIVFGRRFEAKIEIALSSQSVASWME